VNFKRIYKILIKISSQFQILIEISNYFTDFYEIFNENRNIYCCNFQVKFELPVMSLQNYKLIGNFQKICKITNQVKIQLKLQIKLYFSSEITNKVNFQGKFQIK
jgi:hypothetical protein